MKKDAYWFSHDSNASSDEKILELRSEFGWEGYGLFWAIVEKLRDSKNYQYSSNATAGLALSLCIDKDKLKRLLDLCISLKLFVEKDGFFYSESLLNRMEELEAKRRRRAEAGRLGGLAKATAQQSSSNATAIPSYISKVKESKEEENKESNNVLPGQKAPTPKGAKKTKGLSDKEQKFLDLFNETTSRKFETLNAKARKQLKVLLEASPKFTEKQFQKAVAAGHKDSLKWPNPSQFTPEYITRDDKFDKYLNAIDSVTASVAASVAGMGNIKARIAAQQAKD
jgi:hypothetical protein